MRLSSPERWGSGSPVSAHRRTRSAVLSEWTGVGVKFAHAHVSGVSVMFQPLVWKTTWSRCYSHEGPMFSLSGASDGADRAALKGPSLGAASQEDTCPNGPAPQLPDPPPPLSPTSSPVGPDAPPGGAGFHDNLMKSQGTSAEGSVRKEALQSLRLSLPMQETQLCKHPYPRLPAPTPPPLGPSPTTQLGTAPCSSPAVVCLVPVVGCAFIR